MKVKVQAPAKINLTLDIIGRRPDGYHDVLMVMQTIDLYDRVTVSTDNSGLISVNCDYPGVPCDDSNIAVKAAHLFFEYSRLDNPGISITIDKEIPTRAGMAGGSADGAAVIIALNKLFNTYLPPKTMQELAARLGADVPFCIQGGTVRASDTGVQMHKIPALPDCHIVVCKPSVSVSTAEAYALCDKKKFTHPPFTQEMVKALYQRDMFMITSSLYNDFEVALDLPEVKEIKRIMYKSKARGALMTGSGSAVFGIFSSRRRAEACAEALKRDYPCVHLCRPVKHGASVID